MPKANTPTIIDGALRYATTHPTSITLTLPAKYQAKLLPYSY
ncbi:hypothetical protein [Richelia sinica]|nr:hypothetical protein [Richelia sinica]